MFLRLNSVKNELLYPYIFEPLDILMPFATANEALIVEKLPGPQLTIIEKFLSLIVLFFYKK